MPGGHGNIKPSDNPKPFQKGNQQGGRKKRILTLAKEAGFSKEDFRRSILGAARKKTIEVEDMIKSGKFTIIEEILLKTLQKAQKDGNFAHVKELMEIVFGKATQAIEHGINPDTHERFNEVMKIGGREINFGK